MKIPEPLVWLVLIILLCACGYFFLWAINAQDLPYTPNYEIHKP